MPSLHFLRDSTVISQDQARQVVRACETVSVVGHIWEFGGQTTAAAKMGEEGGAFAGAMSVSPGVWMYQLTDDGLAVELTGKGTKYYVDDDLN